MGFGILVLIFAGVCAEAPRTSQGPVAECIEGLADPDPSVRDRAVHALANGPDATADEVSRIAELLNHENRDVRHDAFAALRNMGPAAKLATPRLLAILSERSSPAEDRYRAGLTLATIGPAAVEAVPGLLNVLQDEDSWVRLGATEALGGIGSPASQAVPALFSLAVNDSSGGFGWSIHSKACQAMARIGASGLPVLVRALRRGNVDERVTAAATIRRMAENLPKSTRDAIPALRHAIKDKDAVVRVNAAGALWYTCHDADAVLPVLTSMIQEQRKWYAILYTRPKWSPRVSYSPPDLGVSVLKDMGPKAAPAVPVLVEVLQDSSISFLQEQSLETLAEIGASAKSASPHVLPYLWSNNRWERASAARAMLRIAPDAEVPVAEIVTQIADDPFGAYGAISALGEIDRMSREAAVPLLVELLSSPDWRVRLKSLEALGEIGRDAAAASEAIERIGKDANPLVKRAASQALRAVQPSSKEAKSGAKE